VDQGLVDWDGFGSDQLDRVSMPNLQSLIARGSLMKGSIAVH
jgi:hypothetical protein